MNKSIFSRCAVMLAAALAAFSGLGSRVVDIVAPRREFVPNMALRQGGFVLLGRSYAGYPAGTVVELPTSTEATLVAAGQATVSAGPPTPGAVTTTANSGCAGVAAAGSSVVVTHASVSVQSLIYAVVSQAAADGTALRVDRVSVAAGSFTIFLNAAATAAVNIDWAILNPNGSLTGPQ